MQAAVRREIHSEAGGPRALGQWVRRALPITVSEQGPIGGEGLPAVLLSESGERGPAADEPVLEKRLDAFGRAALGAVGALDAAGPRDEPAFAGRAAAASSRCATCCPTGARGSIVGSLLLPALLAALDAFFRARRRRVPIAPWLAWLAVAAVPLPVAWLWLRALGATGVIEVPDGPVLPDLLPAGDERDRRDGLGAAGGRAGVLARALRRGRAAPRRAARRPEANGAPPAARSRASKGSRSRPACGSAASRRSPG